MQFNEWKNIWLDTYKKPFVAPATLELVGYCLNHMLDFNKRNLADIKGYELQQFLTSLNDTGNMQDKCRKYLNEIFEYAYRNRVIEYNPMLAIKLKPYRTENTKPMTESDRHFFLNSIKGKPYELLYLTYLCTGARKSEVIAPGAFTIDKENSLIHIDGTKTYYSKRTMPLFDKLLNALDLVADYKKYYESYTSDYTYLLFKRHCNRIGLKGFCVRSLRSTFSNLCYTAGVREKTISTWLGHSGRNTTSRYYLNDNLIANYKSGQIAKEIEIVNSIL